MPAPGTFFFAGELQKIYIVENVSTKEIHTYICIYFYMYINILINIQTTIGFLSGALTNSVIENVRSVE